MPTPSKEEISSHFTGDSENFHHTTEKIDSLDHHPEKRRQLKIMEKNGKSVTNSLYIKKKIK